MRCVKPATRLLVTELAFEQTNASLRAAPPMLYSVPAPEVKRMVVVADDLFTLGADFDCGGL